MHKPYCNVKPICKALHNVGNDANPLDLDPEYFSQKNIAVITNTCMKLTLIIGSLFLQQNKILKG